MIRVKARLVLTVHGKQLSLQSTDFKLDLARMRLQGLAGEDLIQNLLLLFEFFHRYLFCSTDFLQRSSLLMLYSVNSDA